MPGEAANDPKSAGREWRPGRAWLLVWALLVAYVTLFPFVGWHVPRGGWWLFQGRLLTTASASDVLANLLLFVPAGLLLGWRCRRHAVWRALLVGLLFSTGIETLQAFLPGRVSSWLDVLLNTSGAGAGAMLALAVWRPAWLQRMAVRHLRGEAAATLGLVTMLVWAATQLIPFVPTLDVGALRQALRPLHQAWLGLHPVSPWRCGVYVAITAGLMLMGRELVKARCRSGWLALWMLTLLMLRPLMAGRMLSAEALIGTVVGIGLALTMYRVPARAALWLAVLLILVQVLVAPLQPGPPDSVRHAMNWIPLHAQMDQPINGLAHLADAIWPWLALACLGVQLGLRKLWSALPLLVLLLAGVEWAQTLVPGRYPDVTTVLAGMAAWMLAARHVERAKVGSATLCR